MGSLYQLARLCGVQTAYRDMFGRRVSASPEALAAVLRSLGAEAAGPQDAEAALRAWRLGLWRRPLEPVTVAWDGKPASVDLRLPAGDADKAIAAELALEGGERRQWRWRGADLRPAERAEVEGGVFARKRLPGLGRLPPGYHRLSLAWRGGEASALIIAAPGHAHPPPDPTWGVFLPLYSLWSRRSWGAGDFGDLARLMEWAGETGAGVVGTLPLTASFLDEPYEYSPYAPASRLFWNELFIDVPGLAREQGLSMDVLETPALRSSIRELQAAELVDYRRGMAVKRQVLQCLARDFFARGRERTPGFRDFLRARRDAERYARFRAVGDSRRAPWQDWPEPLRQGKVRPGDYAPEDCRYHLYVQHAADRQLLQAAGRSRPGGPRLYLDMPIGVHPASFDTWSDPSSFLPDVSAGAPPDAMFPSGQNWGFPPSHPFASRERGHHYFIACLRHLLSVAGVLRLDHVMGLHRLFCIPRGMDGRQGVYVRYPAEELYAILSLESHRHGAWIVGENLGVVPGSINRALRARGVGTMYVLQYQLQTKGDRALRAVPDNTLASVNTHDVVPFAGFWHGVDVDVRRGAGLLQAADAARETSDRLEIRAALARDLAARGLLGSGTAAGPVYEACLEFLARSRAAVVLVNLEDLWSETLPQNTPSTGQEQPNWRRKARHGLDEFSKMDGVRHTLGALAGGREGVQRGR